MKLGGNTELCKESYEKALFVAVAAALALFSSSQTAVVGERCVCLFVCRTGGRTIDDAKKMLKHSSASPTPGGSTSPTKTPSTLLPKMMSRQRSRTT